MKTLDEMMTSGCERLLQLQLTEAKQIMQAKDAEQAAKDAYWANVRAALTELLPKEFVDAMLSEISDGYKRPNNTEYLNVLLQDYAPFQAKLNVAELLLARKTEIEFFIPGIFISQPSIYEGVLYEGYVNWKFKQRLSEGEYGFSTMTITTDPEIALALAASRYLVFKEAVEKSQAEYEKLKVEFNEKIQKREAEYIPVETEELSPLVGMSQALRTLVFSLVDERLEIRGY